MISDLTPDGVSALAPDSRVAAAGKKLGAPKSWQGLGRSPDAIWGECRGSAVYQVRVDLSDLAVKCSCPSRKYPCKHGIGLLFLSAAAPPAEASPPDWVTDWLARRAARAKPKADAGELADRSVPVDPKAKEKRAKKRLARISSGLEALDLWMEDLVRGGLAAVGTKPSSFWGDQAKRMVDAQAPGVAARLRRLSTIPNSSADWPERLLDGLGRIALLSASFQHLDGLDAPLAESVRSEVGITLSQEEIMEQGEKVEDDWIVLGQRTTDEDRLKIRRTWLLGQETRRYALILQFSAAGSPFTEGFVSGTVQKAELAFYPSAYPLRAVVRTRSGSRGRVERLPGHETLGAFLDHTSEAMARQPWIETLPTALSSVTPMFDGSRWLLRDRDGEALPLAEGEHWTLLALSGGKVVDLAAEWEGGKLRPIGIVTEGKYRILQEGAE